MARTAPSTRRRRRARRRNRRIGLITTAALVPVMAIAIILAELLTPAADAGAVAPAADAPAEATVDTAPVPLVFDDEQRANAATIIAAGRDLGLSVRDQTIGVMTAMGESSLRNIDYGDWETSGVTNPDGTRTTSIGLFQQQDGWGSRDQRLDPYTAATLFYRAMVAKVPDRDAVAPTLVAHRTQINKNPDHYARYWPRAIALVESVTGTGTGLEP